MGDSGGVLIQRPWVCLLPSLEALRDWLIFVLFLACAGPGSADDQGGHVNPPTPTRVPACPPPVGALPWAGAHCS